MKSHPKNPLLVLLRASSGKQKKTRSANHPQIRSENSLATIESDQILMALQQLAKNIFSENITCNIL